MLLLTIVSISLEDCIFVDYKGLNDQITYFSESSQTDYCYSFKENLIQQDGPACIVTRQPAELCNAAHLIPRCKGDKVMSMVVSLCDSLITSF
jgi:hypothetical protein